jgi:hypothetical protein
VTASWAGRSYRSCGHQGPSTSCWVSTHVDDTISSSIAVVIHFVHQTFLRPSGPTYQLLGEQGTVWKKNPACWDVLNRIW